MSTVQIADPITVHEAAEIIGCTDGRVRQLFYEKTLKGDYFGGRAIAISRSAAREYAKRPRSVGRPRSCQVG
jgi:hypothetical protein